MKSGPTSPCRRTSSSAFPARRNATSRRTLDLVRDVGFDQSFSFIYSPRPGTPAASLPDDVPHDVKQKRLERLQAQLNAQARRSAAAWSAPCSACWSSGRRRSDARELAGRTENNRWVNFDGPADADRPVRRRRHHRGDAQLAAGPAGRRHERCRSTRLNAPVESRELARLAHARQSAARESRAGRSTRTCARSRTPRRRGAPARQPLQCSGPPMPRRTRPARAARTVRARGERGARPRARAPGAADSLPQRPVSRARDAAAAATGHPHARGGIRGRGPNQRQYLDQIRVNDLTFGIGPAGTGKTYLAVASAVEALHGDSVRRIVLVRPAVEAGERLGFLPGDLTQKVDPYLRPMYDALLRDDGIRPGRAASSSATSSRSRRSRSCAAARSTTRSSFSTKRRTRRRADEDVPDAHRLRLARRRHGRRHADRLAARQGSGLRHAIEVLRGVEGIAFSSSTRRDVVRHPLVQRIVQAYERSTDAEDTRSTRGRRP